jgi:hypothetical protein
MVYMDHDVEYDIDSIAMFEFIQVLLFQYTTVRYNRVKEGRWMSYLVISQTKWWGLTLHLTRYAEKVSLVVLEDDNESFQQHVPALLIVTRTMTVVFGADWLGDSINSKNSSIGETSVCRQNFYRVKLDVTRLLIPCSNCANSLCWEHAVYFRFRAKRFWRFALTLAFGMRLSPSSCDWTAKHVEMCIYSYQMNEWLEVIKKEHSPCYLSECFF